VPMTATSKQGKVVGDRITKRRPWLLGCVGVGIGLPILCATILFILFKMNNRPPQIHVPTPVMPVPNAYDDFAKAGQLFWAMQHKSPYSMTGPQAQNETLANFAACARDAQPGLAVLRRGLGHEYRQPPVRSFGMYATSFSSSLREAARTVAGTAGYYSRVNQPGKAAETLLDGMELGVMMPRGGPLIADLVGIAIEAICSAPFEPLLPHLSASELAHVATRLDAIAAKRLPSPKYSWKRRG
jgi:hypothetical protein